MDTFDGIVFDPKIVDRLIREVHDANQPNSSKLRQRSEVADRFIGQQRAAYNSKQSDSRI